MIVVLIPTFLLTAAIFGVGSFFAAGFVFAVPLARLRRLVFLAAGLLVVLPPLYFGVYMLAVPKDPNDPPVTPAAAAIPATWLAVVLAGVLLGLAFAWRHRRRHGGPPAVTPRS